MNAGDFFYINAGGAFLNLDTPVVPSALFIALFTDSVTATGVGAEVEDTFPNSKGYIRAPLAAGSFSVIADSNYLLTDDLDFAPATQDWGTIQSLAIVTDATTTPLTGLVVAFGDLTETPPGVIINADDTFRVLNGFDFVITIV